MYGENQGFLQETQVLHPFPTLQDPTQSESLSKPQVKHVVLVPLFTSVNQETQLLDHRQVPADPVNAIHI